MACAATARADSLPKRLTADLYYRAHNYLSSDKIPEHAGDFRLLDRSVVEVIRAMPERNRFMKGLFAWSGFRQAAVEYERAPRAVGKTKFRYWKLWTLALDGLTSASTMPLRIWSYIGVVDRLLRFALCGLRGGQDDLLRQRRRRLSVADGRDPVLRRAPADLAGRARRICRPHPGRDQAAAALRRPQADRARRCRDESD